MQLLSNTTSPFARIARIAMIEKGIDVEPTIVDPWADDEKLRAANVATRVPTLVLDDGTPLTESLLIVQWLEHTRPAPKWPSLCGRNAQASAGVLSRAGVAMGAIEASVHTLITRKVTAPQLFDDTPVGLRRQRTMIEALQGLDQQTPLMNVAQTGTEPPSLDVICAVVLYDYQQFRFGETTWLPRTPMLATLASTVNERISFKRTLPY